jgi:hypothetical protein
MAVVVVAAEWWRRWRQHSSCGGNAVTMFLLRGKFPLVMEK